ncbi:MAG: hypothetical protein ACLQIQ_12960 [Beijerinckiaceae bacterium]
MLRLSRGRVIGDIELMINRPGPALGQRKWTAKGAECSVDRHSYSGEVYGFHADVLHIRVPATGRPAWELVIVAEFWSGGDGETMHSTKWLKLMSGKPTDVLKWISANRD